MINFTIDSPCFSTSTLHRTASNPQCYIHLEGLPSVTVYSHNVRKHSFPAGLARQRFFIGGAIHTANATLSLLRCGPARTPVRAFATVLLTHVFARQGGPVANVLE
jgi:hypothetical protein